MPQRSAARGMSRSELLLPPPDDRLHLWPVSKRVNRTGNVDGPRPFIVPQINSKIHPRAAGCSTNRPSNGKAPDYKSGGQEFEISSGAPIESTYYFNFPNCADVRFAIRVHNGVHEPAQSYVARWCTSPAGHPSSGSHGLGRGPPAAPGVGRNQRSAHGGPSVDTPVSLYVVLSPSRDSSSTG